MKPTAWEFRRGTGLAERGIHDKHVDPDMAKSRYHSGVAMPSVGALLSATCLTQLIPGWGFFRNQQCVP